jgi:F0F1-type ATP synthase membrane subunit c/vacuolar-type H+-ATPase subunit K
MRAFVSEPSVRAALAWLVLDASTSEVRTVRVRPGAVVLVRSDVDAASACANLSAVLQAQLAVAEAAERMPPPERAVGTSELEAAARRNPTRLALFIVFGLLGVLLLLGLVIVAVVLNAESSTPSRGRPGSGAATEPPRRPASR